MRIEPARTSAPLLLVYALAGVGGVIGYVPLLTLLLPIKVGSMPGDGYVVLAWCGAAGALAAAVANVGFGWLGDRSVALGGGRRGWLAAGTVMTAGSFAGVALARGAVAVVVAIVLFQVAVNAVLAQVNALIAEEIPGRQKGTVAALLTLGNPVAAAASALVIAVAAGEGARLAVVAALMAACILPLALAPPRPAASQAAVAPPVATRRNLAVAGLARLVMQVAGSAVALYLFFYFEALAGTRAGAPATLAWLLIVASVVPVPLALLLGRLSDRIGRRRRLASGAALLAAAGLAGMAAAASWTAGAIGYVVFATGFAIFLALNIGHAMLLLPDTARRGRDLGILNLANTLPQIVAPPLTLWTTRSFGLAATMAMMAGLALAAGALSLRIDGDG